MGTRERRLRVTCRSRPRRPAAAGFRRSVSLRHRGQPSLPGGHYRRPGHLPVPAAAREISGEHHPQLLMEWFFAGCFSLLCWCIPCSSTRFSAPWWSRSGAGAFSGGGSPDQRGPVLDHCVGSNDGNPAPPPCAPVVWPEHRVRALGVVVAAALCASFATSIGIDSGLSILLGALGVVALTGLSDSAPGTWRLAHGRLVVQAGGRRPIGVASWRLPPLGLTEFGHTATTSSTTPTLAPGFRPSIQSGTTHISALGISTTSTGSSGRTRTPKTEFVAQTPWPDVSPPYENAPRHVYLQIVEHTTGFVLRRSGRSSASWSRIPDRFLPAFVLVPLGSGLRPPEANGEGGRAFRCERARARGDLPADDPRLRRTTSSGGSGPGAR